MNRRFSLGQSVSCGLVVAGALLASQAQATTYFSDDFEAQTDPLTAPPTGSSWNIADVGDGHSIDAGVGFGGSDALNLRRTNDGVNIGELTGVGTAGGLVAGNVIEYVFLINQVESPEGTTHNFNAPIQNSIGFSNNASLLTFGTLNGGDENYYASDFGTGNVDLGVTVPRNTAAYDAIRIVLTLTEPAAGQIGGTYEIFIDVDDADGIATTSRGVYNLTPTAVPVAESTNPSFWLRRGGFTSTSLYDNISITQVPEPGSMALLFSGAALMFVRRSSKK